MQNFKDLTIQEWQQKIERIIWRSGGNAIDASEQIIKLFQPQEAPEVVNKPLTQEQALQLIKTTTEEALNLYRSFKQETETVPGPEMSREQQMFEEPGEINQEAFDKLKPGEYSEELQEMAEHVLCGYEPRGTYERPFIIEGSPSSLPMYDKETVGEMLCVMVERWDKEQGFADIREQADNDYAMMQAIEFGEFLYRNHRDFFHTYEASVKTRLYKKFLEEEAEDLKEKAEALVKLSNQEAEAEILKTKERLQAQDPKVFEIMASQAPEPKEEVPYHYENIKCPECENVQIAKVEHSAPWFSYVHTCENCKHLITESEWNRTNNPPLL